MEIYYLDADYRVHLEQNEEGTLLPWMDEDGAFADKCTAYVAGHRVVPHGCTWTRPDGVTFEGLMIVPAVDYDILLAAQAELDEALALIESGATE